MSTMATRLVSELTERGETLSFCESLTAGLASATVASVPGASAVLRGGLITYATEVKSHFLHQPVADIEAAGVVSGETALAMARAAVAETAADWGIGLTGVAGPDLQEGKPAGTVYIGIYSPGRVAFSQLLSGLGKERNEIREATVAAALRLLCATVEENPVLREQ